MLNFPIRINYHLLQKITQTLSFPKMFSLKNIDSQKFDIKVNVPHGNHGSCLTQKIVENKSWLLSLKRFKCNLKGFEEYKVLSENGYFKSWFLMSNFLNANQQQQHFTFVLTSKSNFEKKNISFPIIVTNLQ
jgi:hypothetical protein